jgi:hypothetical protein
MLLPAAGTSAARPPVPRRCYPPLVPPPHDLPCCDAATHYRYLRRTTSRAATLLPAFAAPSHRLASRWSAFTPAARTCIIALPYPAACRYALFISLPLSPFAAVCRRPHRPPPLLAIPTNTLPTANSPNQLRADYESTAARTSSRRHRDRGNAFPHRTRSTSPFRAESSRRRRYSRSPPNSNGSPPRPQSERPRDGSRRFKKERSEVFPPGATPRGGVCAACLGRHDHAYGKCEGRKLWDGTDASARKNEHGKLVAADGLPLCYDFQLPKGCSSSLHLDRHTCSGCGKTGHGAQKCPRAEKA